ncbi:hypothetical protein DPX16_5608 [Anabarilius grahami]|uniref:Uncharacterized protein n=1 Tax=Anabarilius grahami TaxID=495550 RepID=A0A3N0Y9X9_ANAGA|nr:hypothetical protein DPX16_5608 [Anabarilius grahami]
MGRRSTSSCSGAAAAIRAAGPPVQPPLTARDSHGRDTEEREQGGGMETPPRSVNRSTDTTHAKQKRTDRQSHPALMQHTDERKHPERVESCCRTTVTNRDDVFCTEDLH